MTTTTQQLIDANRINHMVTYDVTRHAKNTLSPNYIHQWMLYAECKDCGWSGYTVRDSIITVRDKDELLLKHHLGIVTQ